MNFYVLTLFPAMIAGFLSHSITGRAITSGAISVTCVDIRDFAENKHRRVDDYPYGGGAGMVMQPGPVCGAYRHAMALAGAGARVVYLTPQGRTFSQNIAREYAKEQSLVLLCGHYEGIDERAIEEIAPEELSIGDYVLTGGEVAAVAVVDAVSRLVPGVLGSGESAAFESFEDGLLEYPQYTRPAEFMGRHVPEALLSGHHANISAWRRERAIERTRLKRPDLLR